MSPRLLILPLGLAACGHLSNDPMTEDAAFLAALPSAAALGPFRPDGEAPPAGGASLIGPRGFTIPGPVAGVTPFVHGRVTGQSAGRTLDPQTITTVEGPGRTAADLPNAGEVVLPQAADPGGGPDDPDDVEQPTRARLAPRAQSDEMFDYLDAQMAAVYAIADLARATPPSLTESETRAWDTLVWRGAPVSATIDTVGSQDYAWSFAAADQGFADGTWTPTPPAGEWQGALSFDASAWSTLFGVAGAGVMDVDYDTRAGAELQLAFTSSSYADTADTCAGVPIMRRPAGLVPGRVSLGAVQHYAYVAGAGDYQFSTLRQHGCGEPAISTVRVRWTAAGGRADAVVRIGATEWTRWSECWVGPNDRGPLVYEVIVSGDDVDAVLTESGDPAACAYADFGDVDADITAGAVW